MSATTLPPHPQFPGFEMMGKRKCGGEENEGARVFLLKSRWQEDKAFLQGCYGLSLAAMLRYWGGLRSTSFQHNGQRRDYCAEMRVGPRPLQHLSIAANDGPLDGGSLSSLRRQPCLFVCGRTKEDCPVRNGFVLPFPLPGCSILILGI